MKKVVILLVLALVALSTGAMAQSDNHTVTVTIPAINVVEVTGGNITLTGDTFIFTGRNANVRIPYATISKVTVGSRHNRFYMQTDNGQVHEFKVPANRCVWYIEKLNAAARVSRQ